MILHNIEKLKDFFSIKYQNFRDFILRYQVLVSFGIALMIFVTLSLSSTLLLALVLSVVFFIGALSILSYIERQSIDPESNSKNLALVSQLNPAHLEKLASASYALALHDTDSDAYLAAKYRINSEYPREVGRLYKNDPDIGLHMFYAVDDNKPFLVTSRGTDTSNLDGAIGSDFDPEGPGYSIFTEHADQIVDAIIEKCEAYGKREIDLTGHSLGGSFTQLLVHQLLKRMSEGALPNISVINMAVFQSSGVNPHIVQESKLLLEAVKQQRKDSFTLNAAYHVQDLDLVPWTGKQIFLDVGPELANIYLVRKHKSFLSIISCFLTFNFHRSHVNCMYSVNDKKNPALTRWSNNGFLQCFSNKDKSGQATIDGYLGTEQFLFLRNEGVHSGLSNLQNSTLAFFSKVLFGVISVAYFLRAVVLFAILPTLSNFSVVYASLYGLLFSGSDLLDARDVSPKESQEFDDNFDAIVPQGDSSSTTVQGSILAQGV